MRRDRRFPVVLSIRERRILDRIAKDEALSAASVVRRLIIREARKRGLWPPSARQVKKGSQAAFILAPCVVTYENDAGEKCEALKGFRAIPVFGHEDTEGEELPELDYAPAELPPLDDVARRIGIDVSYLPLPADRLGACSVDGERIKLGTHDPMVFFHELAHAAHARLEGKLAGGQHAGQETVAEFTAAVLMQLYGLGDRISEGTPQQQKQALSLMF